MCLGLGPRCLWQVSGGVRVSRRLIRVGQNVQIPLRHPKHLLKRRQWHTKNRNPPKNRFRGRFMQKEWILTKMRSAQREWKTIFVVLVMPKWVSFKLTRKAGPKCRSAFWFSPITLLCWTTWKVACLQG